MQLNKLSPTRGGPLHKWSLKRRTTLSVCLTLYSLSLSVHVPWPPPLTSLFIGLTLFSFHPRVLVVSRTSPSDGSRCSSSMGYLEPRPSSQPPADQQAMSPKDVQKQLMEKVATLTTPSPDTMVDKEQESETRSEAGAEGTTKQPMSRSSQSLDKAGTGSYGRRLSLGTFLQR